MRILNSNKMNFQAFSSKLNILRWVIYSGQDCRLHGVYFFSVYTTRYGFAQLAKPFIVRVVCLPHALFEMIIEYTCLCKTRFQFEGYMYLWKASASCHLVGRNKYWWGFSSSTFVEAVLSLWHFVALVAPLPFVSSREVETRFCFVSK